MAVLLVPMDSEATFNHRLWLMEYLRPYADREVDVIVLNDVPPILQNQVLRHGWLLYERDRSVGVEFGVRAGQVYADLKPRYDFHTRDLLQESRR